MDALPITQILQNAKIAYEADEFEQAAQWYDQAAAHYTQQNDTLNAAEMINNRSVSLLRAGSPQLALQIVQGTEIVFAQAGDRKRQAVALGNQAAANDALHRTDEAIRLYQQSNELLKQIDEPGLRLFVLQSLSGLYLKRSRYLEALAAMDVALEIKQHLSLREKILRKLLQVVFRMMGRNI